MACDFLLQDKEQIVLILNELLDKSPVTPIDLIHFKVLHPSIFRDMENGEKFSETSLGRCVDSEDGDASLAPHRCAIVNHLKFC